MKISVIIQAINEEKTIKDLASDFKTDLQFSLIEVLVDLMIMVSREVLNIVRRGKE